MSNPNLTHLPPILAAVAFMAAGCATLTPESDSTAQPPHYGGLVGIFLLSVLAQSEDSDPPICEDCGRSADEGAEGIEIRYDGHDWCAACWAEEVRICERQADEDFRTDWQR